MTPGFRVALALALVLLSVAGSWNHELWIYDEPREAELARATFRSGNWLYTVLNERPFLEKPPLFTDAVALAFTLLGRPSILAARLVAAAFALGTVAVTGWFGARALDERAGWLAALLLATTTRFFVIAHQVLLDNALCFFTTAAIACGWFASRDRRRRLAALAGLAVAGAFLTKGLVGCAIVGVALVAARPRRTLAWAAVGLVPIALYVFLLWRHGGAAFVEEMLWRNQVGRFVESYATKTTSWDLYLRTWPETFIPWTPLAAVALARVAFGRERRAVVRFVALWAVVPLVLLSFSRARARPYALPVIPAHAVLVAALLREAWPAWARALLVRATVVVGALPGAVLAWFLIAHRQWVDGTLVGAAALGAGAAAVARRNRPFAAALAVLALWLAMTGRCAVERIDPERSFKPISDELWARVGARRLYLFHNSDSYSGTFPFYADRSVREFDDQGDPAGERLLASLGPGDVAFAPEGALLLVPEEKRRELVVEWRVEHRKGRTPNPFVLFRRAEAKR